MFFFDEYRVVIFNFIRINNYLIGLKNVLIIRFDKILIKLEFLRLWFKY